MKFQVGDTICADGMLFEVLGRISFRDTMEGSTWDEYRLRPEGGGPERWLTVDEGNQEYSLWEVTATPDMTGYHQVDQGTEEVVSHAGDVDVSTGERAFFSEFEDKTEEKIISNETWDGERETSVGYYLDADEFWQVSSNAAKTAVTVTGNTVRKNAGFIVITVVFVLTVLLNFIPPLLPTHGTIAKYLKKNSAYYSYVTSITGNEKQKANVYKAVSATVDAAATDIINAIEGDTEYVQRDDAETEGAIAILTDKEYCLVYSSLNDEVLVQISNRKYAYTTDDDPYQSSDRTRRYYRRFYYSTGYTADSSSYHYASPYSSYSSADTISYSSSNAYNTYSNSVRQSSIASRSSSGGGLSGGK